MINVRIAVVDTLEDLKKRIDDGYYPCTVTVPYGVFLKKIREKSAEVYELNLRRIKDGKPLRKLKISDLLPSTTYILFKESAGYSPEMGLTFVGKGNITGFEKLSEAERVEKYGSGRDQTWKNHALGTLKRAARILEIHRPFVEDWLKSVFKKQDSSQSSVEENTDAVILAIKVAALFHDLGKLKKEWQEAVGWQTGKEYIARTTEKYSVPFHSPYAYPFLRKLLRFIFGDFRFLDMIALATIRHHTLEVSGVVRPDELRLVDKNVIDLLYSLLLSEFPEMKELEGLEKVLAQSIEEVNKGSTVDEPPSPSDDFYFIYTLTNRVIKFADWEDAGNSLIELADL